MISPVARVELIVGFLLPAQSRPPSPLGIRDRESYGLALDSGVVALDLLTAPMALDGWSSPCRQSGIRWRADTGQQARFGMWIQPGSRPRETAQLSV
jgi:hypothetical protein